MQKVVANSCFFFIFSAPPAPPPSGVPGGTPFSLSQLSCIPEVFSRSSTPDDKISSVPRSTLITPRGFSHSPPYSHRLAHLRSSSGFLEAPHVNGPTKSLSPPCFPESTFAMLHKNVSFSPWRHHDSPTALFSSPARKPPSREKILGGSFLNGRNVCLPRHLPRHPPFSRLTSPKG